MFHFLTIANLSVSKGVLLLLDAGRQIRASGTEFHIHLVGAPTAEISAQQIQREICGRGLEDVVTYHGCQYGADKEARFAEADAFVHPTMNDCFPLVLLEAMQHALPVITTSVGAIPDIVSEGETGLLIPPHDVSALAAAMLSVAANPDQGRAMGRAGKCRYNQKFTVSAFEQTLVSILKNV